MAGDSVAESSRQAFPAVLTLYSRIGRQRTGSGRVQCRACSVVSVADATEIVEVAPIDSTGGSNGSIISLDEHRNEKTKMELIVTLHGKYAATLDAGDDRWLHARTTSMGEYRRASPPLGRPSACSTGFGTNMGSGAPNADSTRWRSAAPPGEWYGQTWGRRLVSYRWAGRIDLKAIMRSVLNGTEIPVRDGFAQFHEAVPRAFAERILAIDSREDGFLRQHVRGSLHDVRNVANHLVKSGWIDRVIEGPRDGAAAAALHRRWIGISAPRTPSSAGAGATPAEATEGISACGSQVRRQHRTGASGMAQRCA